MFYGLVVIAITLLNMASYRVLSSADKDNIALLNRLLTFKRLHVIDLSIKFAGLVVCITLWPPAMSVAVLLTLLIIVPKQLRRKDVTV
jgi:DMSO reductase anchor subunit